MKQILIASCMLAILLAFCIFSCCYVHSRTGMTLQDLRLAQIQAGNGDFLQAADAILAAEQRWKNNLSFFQTVLRHEDADEIAVSLASLRQYALAEDADDFAACSAELIVRVQNLRQMQLPLVSNLF